MAKKDNKSKITELKQQISDNKLKNIYLFYGEEEYLKEYYIKKIEALIPDADFPEYNRIVINDRVDYEEYESVWESMPMMTDRRLLIIRDSNIFITTRSGGAVPPNDEQKQFWKNKFSRLAEDTVVIFCEKKVDARSVLFKAVSKAGMAVEFEYLTETDLRNWVLRRIRRAGKKIESATADYLISIIDPGLTNLENELNKIISYCGDEVHRSDIDNVVSKALGIKVFDITDGIIMGDARKVFSVLKEMKTQNESGFGIMYLIYSNAEKMLHLKLAGVKSRREAAGVIGGNAWAAGRYFDNSRSFSVQELVSMVKRVPELDYDIKNGKITEWQAVESYVAEAVEKRQKRRDAQ